MSTQRNMPTRSERDPDMVSAEAALHRAARRARQRAEHVSNDTTQLPPVDQVADHRESGTGRGPIQKGTEHPVIVSQALPPSTPTRGTFDRGAGPETSLPGEEVLRIDDRHYSFSQAQGYEEIPAPLKLGELPQEARTQIWNLFFSHIRQAKTTGGLDVFDGGPWIAGPWGEILRDKHLRFDCGPLDEWNPAFSRIHRGLREYLENEAFNRVFDLIQFVMRHRRCPPRFIKQMKTTFAGCRLAYIVDVGRPPTILPAVTPEEGNTVVESLRELRKAGLESGTAHLRAASGCINAGDWAGGVRESIHAVESVARHLDPKASKTLGPALSSLERRRALHPALKGAFSQLYGYTNQQQGIRHALLDETKAPVGQDEAVFMLGACAAFASYLWRKHKAGEPR